MSEKKLKPAQLLVHNYIQENSTEHRQKWDDLVGIYQACAEGMMSNLEAHHAQLTKMAEANLKTNMLDVLVAQYAKDIEVLFAELESIHVEHKERSGYAKDSSEYMAIIGLAEQYNVFRARMSNTMMSFNLSLTEEYTKIKLEASAKMAAQEESDKVNGISDAVVKNEVKE